MKAAVFIASFLKKQGITHLFLDGFSRQVSTTVQIIYKQYPSKLVPLLEAGAQDHPLALLQIRY